LLLGLSLPLVAAGPPTAPIIRRAKFREVGDSVIMDIRLPELLPKRDADAMASLDSGFATRLVYEVTLYKYVRGQAKVVRTSTREVRIHWNYWDERYVVETIDDGGSPGRLNFKLREDALKEVGRLRKRVGKVSEMERGDRNAYFVSVFAQRNPTRKDPGSTASTRGQSGDLRMFSRWVSIFVRSRLSAEKTMVVRTNYFYLVES
jgi:hypothetical protein